MKGLWRLKEEAMVKGWWTELIQKNSGKLRQSFRDLERSSEHQGLKYRLSEQENIKLIQKYELKATQ